jgi:hypothetical protein
MRATLFLLVALFFVTLVAAKGSSGHSSGSSSGGESSGSSSSSTEDTSSSSGSSTHSSSGSSPGGVPDNSTSAAIENYKLTPLFVTGAVVSSVFVIMN